MFFPETSHLENVIKFLEAIWWLLRIDHDTELFVRPCPLEALPVFSNSSTKYLSFLYEGRQLVHGHRFPWQLNQDLNTSYLTLNSYFQAI